MGNCQAADTAAVVIQHPSSGNGGGGGRVEHVHGVVSAAAVMAANPGHYVAEVVRPVAAPATTSGWQASAPVRRRLKLLRPDDTLVLGGVYRLVSFEDVLKQFVSKRNATLSRATIGDVDDDGHRRRGYGGGEAPEAAGSMPPAKVTTQSHQKDPSSSPSPADEAQPEPEPEPNLVAATMALGGRMSLSRHGQWRPALPSIAEGSVVC